MDANVTENVGRMAIPFRLSTLHQVETRSSLHGVGHEQGFSAGRMDLFDWWQVKTLVINLQLGKIPMQLKAFREHPKVLSLVLKKLCQSRLCRV